MTTMARIAGVLGAATIMYGANWLHKASKKMPVESIEDRIDRLFEISRAHRTELDLFMSRDEHINLITVLSPKSKKDIDRTYEERKWINVNDEYLKRTFNGQSYLKKTFNDNAKEETLIFTKVFGGFAYAGSTNDLFDWTAREKILSGNYAYIYLDIDCKGIRSKKCIITGVKGYLESREEENKFNDKLMNEYVVAFANDDVTIPEACLDCKVKVQGDTFANWKHTLLRDLTEEEKRKIKWGNFLLFGVGEKEIQIPAISRVSSCNDEAMGW